MVLLADSIQIDDSKLTPDFFDYCQKLSEICELKAVAYHDIMSSKVHDNLFIAWL